MQSFTTLAVSNKKCGISKQKAVCLAENIGFNCEYANACGCSMTVTICYFMWERKHLSEFIISGFAAKRMSIMCSTVCVGFVYMHTLVSGAELFAFYQD